jgi:hypothetical protein
MLMYVDLVATLALVDELERRELTEVVVGERRASEGAANDDLGEQSAVGPLPPPLAGLDRT